jgi:thiamine kinase-like enzyme
MGSAIHNDVHLGNYIFNHDKVYVLDFESSWDDANPVHDLGIVAAELKHYFARKKKDGLKAEHYIGHFLWHYSKGDESYFHEVTRVLPVFMSL